MTLRELLKAQGIAEDAITKIEAAMKENKIYTAGEENLDIRYGKLKGQHETLDQQYQEAQKLIEQLKAGGDAEELKQKISEYETEIAELRTQGEKSQVENAVKFELLAAKAKPEDVDYLIFKVRQADADLKMGKDGKVKGLDGVIKEIQAAHPANFESAKAAGPKPVPNPLPTDPKPADTEPKNLADALKMEYERPKE